MSEIKCKVENGILTIESDGKSYSFEAHGEAPRPSMLGWGLSAAGKHWSNRDESIKLEKHTSVQAVAIGDSYAAWYTQEFIPDGEDYKLSKKAKIYLGDLSSGETRELYKGECYGDLVFDGGELYFNKGNKVAVISLSTGEVTELFKHSGIKKNMIDLKITPKRIFFNHWTKDNCFFMWYDRASGETVNPHVDSVWYRLLDEDSAIFQSTDHAWRLDLNTAKKKRFFSGKQIESIRLRVCEFFGIPEEHYRKDFYVKFRIRSDSNDPNDTDDRLYFICEGKANIEGVHYTELDETLNKMGLPYLIRAGIYTDTNGGNFEFAADKSEITEETHTSSFSNSTSTFKIRKAGVRKY